MNPLQKRQIEENKSKEKVILEKWVFNVLKYYGNCYVGSFVKQYGVDKVIKEIEKKGFKEVSIDENGIAWCERERTTTV